MSRVTREEFLKVLEDALPIGAAMRFEIVELERGLAVVRYAARNEDLRPGGTVAGPILFQLADLAMYAAVMSVAGVVPLAVTTDATVHFLRRIEACTLIAKASVLKEGKRLVVGDVRIGKEGEDDAPAAHVVMTYSVPPGG